MEKKPAFFMELFKRVWQRVLRAHGGAGYTFGAFSLLVVLPSGKKKSCPATVLVRDSTTAKNTP